MWIRDRLPQALPGSRMILYGYDSQLQSSGSFQGIDDLARGFLQLLRRLRTTRGITFLAHSLGGLIVKSAIVQLEASSDPIDQQIFSKIIGAICFAVPNLGIEQRHFLLVTRGYRNEALIEDIARISNYLRNLDKRYLDNQRLASIHFFWAYETRESNTTRVGIKALQSNSPDSRKGGTRRQAIEKWTQRNSGQPNICNMPDDRY